MTDPAPKLLILGGGLGNLWDRLATGRVVDFQTILTEMVNKYESSGFKFDFTGPWPPYHFVGERTEWA